jgi:hypothetical protein
MRLPWLALGVVMACGGSTAAAVGDGGTTSDAANANPDGAANDAAGDAITLPDASACDPGAACAVVDVSRFGFELPDASCNMPTICPVARFADGVGSEAGPGFQPVGPDDMANAVCAIAALRDGTVGQVSFRWSRYGGEYTYSETANILQGRVMSGWYGGQQDVSSSTSEYFANPMQDPAYFTTCLQSASGDAYVNCLQGARLKCP